MRFWSRLALAAAVFAVGLTSAAAQEITGTIRGNVTDQTGGVLPGVTVTVRNVGTGETRQHVTSSTGDYNATLLSPGRYEVLFGLAGFQATTARGINLHVNDRLQVDATLKTGTLEETVEVTAGAQLIQPTPAVQSLMDSRQVQELPLNNRNFVQLATLVPGVSSDLGDEVGIGLTNVVSISVNGARRNSVNWLVDGASNVDVGSNVTLLSTPTLESIEEFKIITSSYAAEWPRSGGGIINVVTKSGSNDFRGSAYEFFRNDALNANTYFRNQSTNATIAGEPPRLRYNNFGYTLGGPIKKDKLFFFWSQEWRKIQRVPATSTATIIDPAWLSDPGNANYVAPADRDPNAVRLLEAWPAANIGTNQLVNTAPSLNDTRQEVIRADYLISDRWRLMGRYTHDLSTTEEFGGLFFGALVPNVATTITDVPGQVFVAQLTTTLNSNTLNEFSYQFSSNDIKTTNPEGTRNKRTDYGFTGSELFPENNTGLIPTIRISGVSLIGAGQLYNIEYRNHTIADNLTLQRGTHSFKVGGLATFEAKNENAANATHGDFTFASGGGFTAFQNFIRGNRNGACGAACTYTEAEIDVTNHLRFNRYEAYVQDSWKARPNLTIDAGVRYAVYPALLDENDRLSTFVPSLYNRSRAPQFANPTGSLIVAGTGDPLNGVSVASLTSPHGRTIYTTDKNNFMPRLGITWDPRNNSRTLLRAGFGVYYDQPLVGIFEQNAFVNPPYANTVTVENAALSNPGAGVPRTAVGLRTLQATSDPFETPRTMQWNVGVQRQLWSKAAIDVGYVGSRGDNLIRPIDINLPDPADVVRLGGVNLARPYRGYGTITMRETSASSRYHGLLVNFRYDGGRNGLLNLAYTLSRNRTDSTNDRDAIDLPQNPRNLDAEWAVARTDRTHVFNASYVYELPIFRNSGGLLKAALGGWQLAGITTFQSGPPVSRIVTNQTLGNQRGIRVDQIGDPFSNLPSDRYYINPAAFAPPALGSYGNTGRALFRLPGRNQWDITLSKNWNPTAKTRLQFRADMINAFNHTQFTTINNACNAGANDATCAIANNTFGQFDGVRLPREVQLGLKFYWN